MTAFRDAAQRCVECGGALVELHNPSKLSFADF
jgi:hypothetical protein